MLAGAFVVTPNATRVGPGDTLTIRFSTVEPLSTRPVVAFRQPGRTAVKVTATRLDNGTYRASFRVAAGGSRCRFGPDLGDRLRRRPQHDHPPHHGDPMTRRMPPAARRRPSIGRQRSPVPSPAPVHWPPVSADADPTGAVAAGSPAGTGAAATPAAIPVVPTAAAEPVPESAATLDTAPAPFDAAPEATPVGTGAWVVLPTYNERENIEAISAAILEALPGATLLVVDDSSPDGTGDLADRLAATDPRLRVHHRPGKQGLGRAYLDGFVVALDAGAGIVIQMDADWSHDPAALPGLIAPITADRADLVIGSRYTTGGAVTDWGVVRRVISRGGSVFARLVLGLGPHDLTGGFKAWRAPTLEAVPFDGVRAGGYVFQIEMTYRASRLGARVVEVPITFRDRRLGQSKMSRRIIFEALFVVLRLRWDELRGRGPVRPAR